MADENIQAASPEIESPPALPSDNDYDASPALAPSASKDVPPHPAPAASAHKDAPTGEPKDVLREIAETVVFVIVLVLLLKTFIAEAFVIPTGSMATTLWGYQKVVTCPQCDHEFPVNVSGQVDPANAHRTPVVGCTCPNCLYNITFPNPENNPPWNSGDRVLVFKAWFDSGLPGGQPKRHDVVVFKFPAEPQKDGQAMNYIKRLIGLPEETIAISGGQLYVLPGPRANPPLPPIDAETKEPIFYATSYPWPEDPEAEKLFNAGKFTIIRKAPDKMLALRRIVFDNDNQARDLDSPDQARWQPAGTWRGDTTKLATSFTLGAGDELSWLRYRHLLRGENEPQLIKDLMGYNTGRPHLNGRDTLGTHWVGDLMLECDVRVDQAQGEFRLELSRASDRFQARFDLATGMCQLVRLPSDGAEVVLKQEATPMKGPGTYSLRFANFDERLTLWVNGEMPFGDGVEYPAGAKGPVNANDLEPASIAGKDAQFTVSHIKLWRDTYYTSNAGNHDLRTFYIDPGHYLCLGDNSPESSDGRMWGMVPNRLMLGRALMVYFPFQFPGWLPVNRVGLIH